MQDKYQLLHLTTHTVCFNPRGAFGGEKLKSELTVTYSGRSHNY